MCPLEEIGIDDSRGRERLPERILFPNKYLMDALQYGSPLARIGKRPAHAAPVQQPRRLFGNLVWQRCDPAIQCLPATLADERRRLGENPAGGRFPIAGIPLKFERGFVI